MRKFLDDPAQAVSDALAGFGAAHADLVQLHPVIGAPGFISVAQPVPGKVGLVSGGGWGHEPLHLGFVGVGMLDAAVPGPVFTSPTPDPILAAIRAADTGAGVLLIVKNYTGDVLNFALAAELAAAEGREVTTVVVADDVAVDGSLHTVGRRGVAGTIVVEKMAGAAAARGDQLPAVAALAHRVSDGVRSMGVALSPCTNPGTGVESFALPEGEIELGIGIHGEPGRRRQPWAPAAQLVDQLVDAVLEDFPLAPHTPVLLLVNGLGGTPQGELYLVFGHARRLVEQRGLMVARSLVGTFVTALDMAGASVTVAKLDPELTALWDAPVRTVALRW